MGVLRCDHPDIERFIHAKDEGDSLTSTSRWATDAFMQAVESGEFELVHGRAGRGGEARRSVST
jgi:ribonucleoside-diphosphate reductase alpha chain